MAELQILQQFKQGLITFFDELISMFPTEGDLVIVRIFINDQVPIMDVMEHFVTQLLPLKDVVKERNDEFFLNNNVLFEALNQSRVGYFKTLWQSGVLDKEDKETVFRWFDSFIFLAERYAKLKGGKS